VKAWESDNDNVSSNYNTPLEESFTGMYIGSLPTSGKSSSLERNTSFVSAKSGSSTSSHGQRETIELSSSGAGMAFGSFSKCFIYVLIVSVVIYVPTVFYVLLYLLLYDANHNNNLHVEGICNATNLFMYSTYSINCLQKWRIFQKVKVRTQKIALLFWSRL